MTIRPQMRVDIAHEFILGLVGGIPVSRETERLSIFFRLGFTGHLSEWFLTSTLETMPFMRGNRPSLVTSTSGSSGIILFLLPLHEDLAL